MNGMRGQRRSARPAQIALADFLGGAGCGWRVGRGVVTLRAIDATDAANLMMALGIHPCQEVEDAPLLIGVTHYLSRITQANAVRVSPQSTGLERMSGSQVRARDA